MLSEEFKKYLLEQEDYLFEKYYFFDGFKEEKGYNLIPIPIFERQVN